MLKISMPGVNPYRQALLEFSSNRFAAAMATAMTRTVVQLRKDGQQELPSVFDRPTPYTVRQLRYVPATAQKPAAAVGFDIAAINDVAGGLLAYRQLGDGETPASAYMSPNIKGQERGLKGLEVALRAIGALPTGWLVMPGQGATVDAYGNVARSQVVQVLAQIRSQKAAADSTGKSTRAGSLSTSALQRAGGRYFVIPPGKKVQPGIYQREFLGANVTPVFIFVHRAQYRKRYAFFELMRKRSDDILPQQADRAIEEQLARLRAAGR